MFGVPLKIELFFSKHVIYIRKMFELVISDNIHFQRDMFQHIHGIKTDTTTPSWFEPLLNSNEEVLHTYQSNRFVASLQKELEWNIQDMHCVL